MGPPGLPARRGLADQVPHPPAVDRGVRRAGQHRARAPPTLERWRSVQLIWFRGCRFTARARPTAPATRAILVRPRRPGLGLRQLRRSTASWSSCTTTGGATCAGSSGGPVPDGARQIVTELDRGRRRHLDRVAVGRRRGPRRARGRAHAVRHRPVRGHRRRHRPPLARVWELYERFGSFAYTGALTSVTYTPGPEAPDAPSTMVDMLREIGMAFE